MLDSIFTFRFFITFIGLALFAVQSYSAELLFSEAQSYDIKPSLEVLHDPHHSLNINSLQSDEFTNTGTAQLWRKYSSDNHSNLHSRHVCWLRFSITNVLYKEQQALLVLPNPRQSKISVYVESNQETKAYYTGSSLAFSSRPIEHEYFLFPITLPASSDITVYLKAIDGVNNVADRIQLWRFSDYFMKNGFQPSQWFFIGALIFCAVFLILSALRWRQSEYFALTLFVLSIIASGVVYYGYAFRYVWPNNPELNYHSLYFFVAMAGISLLYFQADFCHFKSRHRLAYIGTIAASSSILLTAIVSIWGPYKGDTRLFLLVSMTAIFLIWQLVILVRHELMGNKQHRSLLVVWAITLLSAVIIVHIKSNTAIDLVLDSTEWVILILCLSLTFLLIREWNENVLNLTSNSVNVKVRDELMSRMNFEVRTPMNAILGAADLLKGSQLTRAQRQYTELLHVSSRSLLRVVNDILDYSRLNSGNLVLQRKSFDLMTLLDEIPSIFSLRASQKNIQLYCHFDKNLPSTVLGDESRLQQLLIYLLDYALKFTHKGAVIVLVYPDPNKEQHIAFSLEGNRVYQGETPIDVNKVLKHDDSFDEKVAFSLGISNSIINQLMDLMGAEYEVRDGTDQGQRIDVSIPMPMVEKTSNILSPLQGANIGWIGSDALYADMLERAAVQEGVNFYQFNSVNTFSEKMSQDSINFDCVLCYGDELDSENIKLLDKVRRPSDDDNKTNMKILVLCDSAQALEWAEQQVVRFDLVCDKHVVTNQVFQQLAMVLQTEKGGMLEKDLSNLAMPSLNILVAEDNEVNIMVIDRMLNRLGHQVSLVKNGALAIELYRHCMGSDERWQHFDLILMDCEMPEIDGLEASKKIRQLETEFGVSPVPIIALTAHGLNRVEEQCIEAGMNLALAKPVSLEKLKSGIERTVDLTQLTHIEDK